jgi:hypothetical protein
MIKNSHDQLNREKKTEVYLKIQTLKMFIFNNLPKLNRYAVDVYDLILAFVPQNQS